MNARSHRFGPHNASLTVRTFREGVGAGAGHDLVLVVTAWLATVELPQWRIALEADPESLELRDAHGGVRPLTNADREQVARNIDRKVLRGNPIAFRSRSVRGSGPIHVDGDLTLAGRTAPMSLRLEVAPDGLVAATIPLVQSRWGIAPFRALMGALRVRDEVVVTVEARLPR